MRRGHCQFCYHWKCRKIGCSINHPSKWAEKTDNSKGHYENPIYNWVLANPILFPEPIPTKGKLSFWEYENINSGKTLVYVLSLPKKKFK